MAGFLNPKLKVVKLTLLIMGCTPPLPKVWLQADFGHNRNSLSHPYSELFISKLMVCESIFRMAQKYLDMLVMYFFASNSFWLDSPILSIVAIIWDVSCNHSEREHDFEILP